MISRLAFARQAPKNLTSAVGECLGTLERRWAEYLTVIATSSFIPLELYELTRGVNPPRLVILAINLAIVWYLVRILRRQRKHKV